LKESTQSNLLCTHPPFSKKHAIFCDNPIFQIDGNFGATAGIAEMLVQSHIENILLLLPALPAEWSSGKLKGFCVRGGITLDMEWKDNAITHLILYPRSDAELSIIAPLPKPMADHITIHLKKDIPYKII
jgi:alpha-L-fucosidase 2